MDLLQFLHELADIPELSVDRCEPHVSYLIESVQALHDQFADLSGGNLPFMTFLEVPLYIFDEFFDEFYADRPLFAGDHDALHQFFSVN